MKKFYFSLIFAFFLVSIIAVSLIAGDSITLENIFSKEEKAILLKGEIITKCFLKLNGAVHTANTNAQINIPETQYTGKYLEQYEMICTEKAFFPYNLTRESKLSFYNFLASASKLSGMKYYSKTDSKILTLITAASRIKSPEDRKSIQDEVFKSIPPKITGYFTITDNRFGDLTFRSELFDEGDNFILKNVCVDPMEKYFVSINHKEEYHLIYFFIYDKESNGYFYYSINAMRIRSDYFLKLGLLSSANFANRMRAGTFHTAKFLGLNREDKLKAFE